MMDETGLQNTKFSKALMNTPENFHYQWGNQWAHRHINEFRNEEGTIVELVKIGLQAQFEYDDKFVNGGRSACLFQSVKELKDGR